MGTLYWVGPGGGAGGGGSVGSLSSRTLSFCFDLFLFDGGYLFVFGRGIQNRKPDLLRL